VVRQEAGASRTCRAKVVALLARGRKTGQLGKGGKVFSKQHAGTEEHGMA
jgi:hypothetical protein